MNRQSNHQFETQRPTPIVAAEVRESQITNQLQYLEQTISRIEVTADQLFDRLFSVMRSEPFVESKLGSERPSLVPLAETILTASIRLGAADEKLRAMMDLLEL
jgi:hypothetical protein